MVIIIFFLLFLIEFDLNLPLDEFGAVDFNYLQNMPVNTSIGKGFSPGP